MAQLMRDSLEVKNRKYRFRTYKSCILETDAIDWLMESVTQQHQGRAIDIFVEMIANGFLMRCTPIASRAKKATNFEKKRDNSALYRFLWDIVDVEQTKKPFANIIPSSAIVTSMKSIEKKAYRLYRKYVMTDTDLEINVSGSIKKTLAKHVHEEGQRMDKITVLAILEVFETLSQEMHKYLEQSFARMDPIYKALSKKERKILGLKMPSKGYLKRLHTLQIEEFDKIRRVRVSQKEERQRGIFLDDLQWVEVDQEEASNQREKEKDNDQPPSRMRRSSTTLIQAIRSGIESWHRLRGDARSVGSDPIDQSSIWESCETDTTANTAQSEPLAVHMRRKSVIGLGRVKSSKVHGVPRKYVDQMIMTTGVNISKPS